MPWEKLLYGGAIPDTLLLEIRHLTWGGGSCLLVRSPLELKATRTNPWGRGTMSPVLLHHRVSEFIVMLGLLTL